MADMEYKALPLNHPEPDSVLVAIIEELCHVQGCHTVILYGSRAKGIHTANSDYDVLAICSTGSCRRDTRIWNGAYLDIFIYNERDLENIDPSFLRLRGGIVLREQFDWGHKLLARVEELFAAGPKALPPDELELRRTWSGKMLERIYQGGTENVYANYRRVWLLFTLLEDYFVLRQAWYLGPKESFVWLQAHDKDTYKAFELALKPGAPMQVIESLVEKVLTVA